ncbi:MAG: extracellular solute-binding protein, partial [Candidatus Limnocylindria bacterium]
MARRRAGFASLVSLTLLLAACSGGTSPSQSAGSSADGSTAASASADTPEETLTVLCTPQEDWCQAMVAAFQEKTGIETSYVRLSSGEAYARLQAGADNPEFSVWWGGPADAFVAANEDGLIEPYDSPNREAIADDQKGADGIWTGVYVGALGFCSNAATLQELGVDVPNSWDDLADPALKGQVAIAHP